MAAGLGRGCRRVAAERDGRVGAAASSYAAILGLALVYLGEHYPVDVLTGALLALAIHRAERLVSRPAGRLADAIDDLHALAWDARPRRRLRAPQLAKPRQGWTLNRLRLTALFG
jgi:membrane-associated phospholipid phosphatase